MPLLRHSASQHCGALLKVLVDARVSCGFRVGDHVVECLDDGVGEVAGLVVNTLVVSGDLV